MKIITVLMLLLIQSMALAHTGNNSYMNFTSIDGSGLTSIVAEWKIPLKDLDRVMDLDFNQDASITWQDIDNNQRRILDYVFSSVVIQRGFMKCQPQATGLALEQLSSGLYLYLPFNVNCPSSANATNTISLNYRLMFDDNPWFRAIFSYPVNDQVVSQILSSQSSSIEFKLDAPAKTNALHFIKEGVWHIWIGLDHILFLGTLLFPIVLGGRANRSSKQGLAVKKIVRDVLKVVTAFTLAHSITLMLAATKTVQLPEAWVETSIAFSVVVGAVFAMNQKWDRWRWVLALGFGFIHGFGFANVLFDLMLPLSSLGVTLFSFNLGVELGQLVLVIAVLPLLLLLRRSPILTRYSLKLSMGVIAGFGLVWLVDRGGQIGAVSMGLGS